MTLFEILLEMHHEALAALDESLAKQHKLIGVFDGRFEKQLEQSKRYVEVCHAITDQM